MCMKSYILVALNLGNLHTIILHVFVSLLFFVFSGRLLFPCVCVRACVFLLFSFSLSIWSDYQLFYYFEAIVSSPPPPRRFLLPNANFALCFFVTLNFLSPLIPIAIASVLPAIKSFFICKHQFLYILPLSSS